MQLLTGEGVSRMSVVKAILLIYLAGVMMCLLMAAIASTLAPVAGKDACYVHYPEHTSRWEDCRLS